MSSKIKKMRPKGSWALDERKLAVVAMVMVISVALALGIVFFARGSKSQGKDSGMIAQTQESAPSATASSTLPTIEELEVPALTIYRERNIFEPLIDMAGVLSAEETGATTETAEGASQGGASTQAGNTAGLPSVRTVPSQFDSDGSRGQIASVVVMLEGVFEQDGVQFAQIRVAGELYGKVAVGEIFAGYYKLVNINPGEVATILYGDEKFTLGVGQSIYW